VGPPPPTPNPQSPIPNPHLTFFNKNLSNYYFRKNN